MLPDRVSNPGPLTYESGALPIALRGPSLYRAVSQREGERGEKRIDESKNVQTTPTRTYYKRSRPLPY